MVSFYFSFGSRHSEAAVKKIADECESFLEGECILEVDRKIFEADQIEKRLKQCDVLMIVIGPKKLVSTEPGLSSWDVTVNEKIRCEIVCAINLDLLIVPVLMDGVRLPEYRKVPGALKKLLSIKSYRLREAYWSEDVHHMLEEIDSELDFKREVERKLSRSSNPNFLGLTRPDGRPRFPHQLGLEHSMALELRRVIESENFNLDQAKRQDDYSAEKSALSALGMAYTRLGQTLKAIQFFEKLLEIARNDGFVEEECSQLANLGDAHAISGSIDRAKAYYQEQLIRADSMGFRPFVGSAFNGLGFVYVKQNQIKQAIRCYLKALEIYRELGDREKVLELLVGIGLNYQKTGDLDRATESLESALEAARYLENRKEEVHVLVDLIDLLLRLGKTRQVGSYIDCAESILDAFDEVWVGPLNSRLEISRKSLKEPPKIM